MNSKAPEISSNIHTPSPDIEIDDWHPRPPGTSSRVLKQQLVPLPPVFQPSEETANNPAPPGSTEVEFYDENADEEDAEWFKATYSGSGYEAICASCFTPICYEAVPAGKRGAFKCREDKLLNCDLRDVSAEKKRRLSTGEQVSTPTEQASVCGNCGCVIGWIAAGFAELDSTTVVVTTRQEVSKQHR